MKDTFKVCDMCLLCVWMCIPTLNWPVGSKLPGPHFVDQAVSIQAEDFKLYLR